MKGVFTAEFAMLFHLESVRIVLLVLHSFIISLFAVGAGKRNSNSHLKTAPPILIRTSL